MKQNKLKAPFTRATVYILLYLVVSVNVFAASSSSFGSSENKSVEAVKQAITITGTVTDTKAAPIPGVNVTVEGTTTGVATDEQGHYSINVPNENSVLIFSFVGYLNEQVTVGTQRVIDIKLIEDIKQLSEVVVTALGIKREEKSLGYAVSRISSRDITEVGNTNFASALYGKAAGVRVNSAPGGASSAVNIQIRGTTSINLNTQPLYVVDGIPIRNHALLNFSNASNNTSYWDETRIRENGILDINPEDIESLTVLKGASASALYGSEAANGVIVITTKKGSQHQGMGVDFNYVYNVEKLAFQPDYQNDYGPGYDRATNVAVGANEEGWITNSDASVRPNYRAYGQFGPKFDGRDIKYWDGSTRKYVAHPDNYKDFFKTGYNSTANIAISNGSEKGSYRFSYTRNDYKGIQPGGKLEKNYFNLNGTLKLSNYVSVDVVSSYINSYTHNRPTMMTRIFGAYDGFFSRADDMSDYFDKYQTSKGYKYVRFNQTQYDPKEALTYNVRAYELLDFLWNQLKNSHDEYLDRFINSATLNISLAKKLNLRGRIGNDFTSMRIEDKQYNQYSSAFGYTGYYGVQNGRYNLVYGDALLTYTDKLSQDLEFTLTGGINGKDDRYTDSNEGTNGGLVNENWFSLNNSANTFTTGQISATRKAQTYMAEFGTLSFNYKSWLFIEGTGRNESTSTLPPSKSSYFYPSVNGAFILSEAVQMPSFINYGKLRASWGIVGNHPDLYQANVSYNQNSVSAATSTALYQYANSNNYGNDAIKSEKKYETEVGLETRLFDLRFGLDVAYYNNKIKDQILFLTTAASTGSSSMLANVGDLTNQGVEIALNATPIKTKSFRWDARFNFAVNRNKVDKLMQGVDYLEMYNADGGSLVIRAAVGQALGDIYVHPIATNASGEKIVSADGLYNIAYDSLVKVGNVTPKALGGFSNSFSYKNISLDFLIDYRFGGQLISLPTYYMYGAGMFKSTLQYRDAANGGLSYNIDGGGNKVPAADGVYHDGIILEGVTESGDPNTTVIDAASYYMNSFGWGSGAGSYNRYDKAVFDNSYIKMREVALTYTLPKSISQKLKLQRVQISLIGRNLFYIWKTLPNLDPEVASGSSWLYQGIDQGTTAPTRSFGAAIRVSF